MRRERAIDRLLPGFIHQFRSPLGTMLSCLQTVLSRRPVTASPEELQMLERNVRRLQQNVQNLLTYAKGDPVPWTTGSLNVPVNALCDYLQELCRARSIRLEKQQALKLPAVRYQNERLQEALLNYAVNALEAMKPGGTLTLAVNPASNGDVQITISDTGVGLALRQLNKGRYRTTKKGGLGLGLAFSAEVLRDHGATVQFASTRGQGTTVTLTFPPIPDDSPAGPS